jgi:glycosidase
MMPLRKPSIFHVRVLIAALLCFAGGSHCFPQKPTVSRIEPPNWWIGLPDPMLLIRGENLHGAEFAIESSKATVSLVRVSQNGHWAFVRLKENGTPNGSLSLTIKNKKGSTSVPYQLDSRTTGRLGPKGVAASDSIYLIMPDRFADGDSENDKQPNMPYDPLNPHAWHGGDLKGVAEHLDYLKTLGVSTVWLTPITENHERDSYHGYGSTDMYSVDPHFGSLDDLKRLASYLHRQDMKFVLDIVPNHVGPGHPWVNDSPTPDWFHGTKASHRPASGVFPALMDPNASQDEVRNVEEGWFVDLLPDMNQENPLVSTYLIQNTMWWVEQTSADGLRLDTFPYVGRDFWHDFHRSLFDQYPRLTTVGEVLNETYILPPAVNAFFAGGSHLGETKQVDTGLYTPFDYPLYGILRSVLLRNAPMTDLDLLLRQDGLYPHPDRLVTLLGSHDTSRFMSEPGATPEKLLLAFGLISTLRGTPAIYSGDEIGMVGGQDPDNRRDFPGGFPASSSTTNAFQENTRTAAQSFIHDRVVNLLAIRRSSTELSGGEQQNLEATPDTLAFVRGANLDRGCTTSHGRVLVLADKSTSPRLRSLPTRENSLAGCKSISILIGDPHSTTVTNGHVRAEIPPVGMLVVRLN